MATQSRDAAIVGAYEYPLRLAPAGMSDKRIRIECARRALEDAGLSWQDVDAFFDITGLFDPNAGGFCGPEYFGFKPAVFDTTMVGGTSFEFHASHARNAIRAGKCNVALLTYGSTPRSLARAIGTGSSTFAGGTPTLTENMEISWGTTLIANYALSKTRHIYQYGTKPEQFAEISVATRAHAIRNPQAAQGLLDIGFTKVNEITTEDVVSSRMVADPLRLLECCVVSDGGGAVVIASADVARTCRKKPVWIIGNGEAIKYRENGGDITVSAGAQSAPVAFGDAGVRPDEVDIAMIYDSFTITAMVCLEDLGFCKKGEGGDFVGGGRLRWDTPAKPALNTDGGGLSSNHPGMRGIFLLIEATRQLRGESTSQVADARLAAAHGNGGYLGGTHAGGTIVLARD